MGLSNQPSVAADAGRAHLSLWDTISIIVGIVIGAGIYETPPYIFQNFSSAGLGLFAWAVGGGLALIGALCYAELATTYPRSGGDYVYLTKAYGPFSGFLFGWAQLAVILSGSIGAMAYIFADYATRLWGLTPQGTLWAALLPVVVFTLLNVAGVVLGKTAINILTVVKVLGLAGILLAGLLATTAPQVVSDVVVGTEVAASSEASGGTSFAAFAAAMVVILLTYGGWNDAAFVAAEVKNKQRDIPRALLLGVAMITVIYLLINAAYLKVLGLEGVQQSSAVAADMLQAVLGDRASQLISILVMISALGAVNGLIFAGARIYVSLGEDHRVFRWLSGWSFRGGSPVPALTAQAIITLMLILAVGTQTGQGLLDFGFARMGFENLGNWEGRSGFETLVKCTAAVFWVFFLLTGISLFVLRYKDPERQRPFKVPLYPVTPLLFIATCVWMLKSSIDYAGELTYVGVGLLVVGIPLYLLSRAGESAVPSKQVDSK